MKRPIYYIREIKKRVRRSFGRTFLNEHYITIPKFMGYVKDLGLDPDEISSIMAGNKLFLGGGFVDYLVLDIWLTELYKQKEILEGSTTL